MRPLIFGAPGIPVFGFGKPSIEIGIDQIPVPENPNFGFGKSYNGRVITQPLFAELQAPISASAPLVPPSAAPGSAWERWEDRGHGGPPRPVVPEPGAYGALLLAVVVVVVVARRVSSLRCPGPR